MLVLTFKEDEDLFLNFNGVEVKIKVVRANEKKTRLGVEAPKEVEVVRGNARNKRKAS